MMIVREGWSSVCWLVRGHKDTSDSIEALLLLQAWRYVTLDVVGLGFLTGSFAHRHTNLDHHEYIQKKDYCSPPESYLSHGFCENLRHPEVNTTRPYPKLSNSRTGPKQSKHQHLPPLSITQTSATIRSNRMRTVLTVQSCFLSSRTIVRRKLGIRISTVK
jgi:hypothetical protein